MITNRSKQWTSSFSQIPSQTQWATCMSAGHNYYLVVPESPIRSRAPAHLRHLTPTMIPMMMKNTSTQLCRKRGNHRQVWWQQQHPWLYHGIWHGSCMYHLVSIRVHNVHWHFQLQYLNMSHLAPLEAIASSHYTRTSISSRVWWQDILRMAGWEGRDRDAKDHHQASTLILCHHCRC
jgi:hypothetical protein